jgi:nicotinamidase/pyrazinamidase
MGNNQVKPQNSNSSNSSENIKFILGIIDPQNDFCFGGELAVKEADFAIAAINKLRFICFGIIDTFISQDFHPENHMSFSSTHNKKNYEKTKLNLEMEDGSKIDVEQVLWPKHCVQNTKGSEFHPDLIVIKQDKIIQKGTKPNVESYSAFGDEFGGKYEKTDLNKWLKNKKITDIILVGVATDYCVYNTALDSIRNGYKVHLILSCTRGVDKDTTEKALEDLTSKGAKFYKSVDEFYLTHKNFITDSKNII